MDEMMNYTEDGGMGDLFDQIDDLLDFPNDDDHLLGALDHQQQLLPLPADIDDHVFLPDEHQQQQQQLEEQADDIEIIPLEWMSQFLEDSDTLLNNNGTHECFSSSSPVSVHQDQNTNAYFNAIANQSISSSSSSSSTLSSSASFPPCYTNEYNQLPISVIPVRTRSKRPRSAMTVAASARPRITIISPVKPPASFATHSEATTGLTAAVSEHESFGDSQFARKKKKITKKKAASDDEYVEGNSDVETENVNVRKCLHCEITKTPQWRAGPMGPRTLCNACGVRYKSGRLFPEYRPAASPTFVPSVHSNSHKKVVEMRNKVDSKKRSCELLDYIRMQRVN